MKKKDMTFVLNNYLMENSLDVMKEKQYNVEN